MKDSSKSDFGVALNNGCYVQAANQRVEEMRTDSSPPLDPPTVSELETVLGDRVEKLELWGKNWRNRVYRIVLASGPAVLAKQVVRGSDAMVNYQYDQLQALAKLNVPGLRVPKAMALLHAKRVVAMEFARGTTIQALVWKRANDDMLHVCELAGKILASIHIAWTKTISRIPVEVLARDLAASPWRLSSREQRILQSTLETLGRAEARIGPVHYDYKPGNLLFENDELFLVDPPDRMREGVQLWDFAVFRSSMRRHLWRYTLWRPLDARRALIRETLGAFHRGYLAILEKPQPEPALFELAVLFFELQRTAVLTSMQKGKVELARQSKPIALNASLGNPIANRLTLAWLELEKRWLFRQLARELR
jgi:Ser/Thr protein kinase RdoA (MazF antagonist)